MNERRGIFMSDGQYIEIKDIKMKLTDLNQIEENNTDKGEKK